jgi:hypothetical protein
MRKRIVFLKTWGVYNANEGPCSFAGPEADRLVNAGIARLVASADAEAAPAVAGESGDGPDSPLPLEGADDGEALPAEALDSPGAKGAVEKDLGSDAYSPIFDYSALDISLEQLRTLARAKGIRGWQRMGEQTLRAALTAHSEV